MVAVNIHAGSNTATYLNAVMQIGGSSVSNTVSQPVNSAANGTCTIVMPVIITANSTAVSVLASIGAGTASGPNHEMSVIRIA